LDALNVFFGYGCVHATDGSFSCWEETVISNSDGSTSSKAVPVDSPAGPFTKVRAGAGHYCGIHADQTVECWGFNPDVRATAPDGKFLDVAPGGFHTCGLKTDHTIACWGDRFDGAATPPAAP
jgi:alpha-tubulin suppressor-like RCC1 family protein